MRGKMRGAKGTAKPPEAPFYLPFDLKLKK
jgi:hypothetical protein